MNEENKEPDFAFGKKLGISESEMGSISTLTFALEKLLQCIKKTNIIHGTTCEFFRLDFRQAYFDEQFQFPYGSLVLDLKFGSKKEVAEMKKMGRGK